MSKSPFQSFVTRFRGGDTIFETGDLGATMYIVQSGRVRLFRSNEGNDHDLGLMEKGDFFGEMSILEGLARAHSATAVDDCELIEINSSTFDKMIRGNIEIAIRMLRKLSIRLRDLDRRLEDLQTLGPQATVAPSSGTAAQSRPSMEAGNGPRLEVPDEGVVFPLGESDTLLGRYDPVTEMRPDVDLTDVDLKRTVSRRHARIVRNGDGCSLIEEIGALNGTLVNGHKLETGKAHPVNDGDEIGLGSVKLVLRT